MSDKSVWDELWSKSSLEEWDEVSQEVFDALLAEIGEASGKRILEAGCGSGRISARLASIGASVHLIDYSEKALSLARDYFRRHDLKGTFHRGDIMRMPFQDGYFDVVWSSGVLEHYGFDRQVSMLREMIRITKDGGMVISIVPYARSPFYRAGKWWAERTSKWVYGEEFPIDTFREHLPYLQGELIKEYSISAKTTLDFLQYIPGGTDAARCLKLALEMEADFKDSLPGYLLVSVIRKSANAGSRAPCEMIHQEETYARCRDLVCLSSIAWDFLKQRPQHVLTRLRDRGFRIFHVNWDKMIATVPTELLPLSAQNMNHVFEVLAPTVIRRVEPDIIEIKPIGKLQDGKGKTVQVLNQFMEWLETFLGLKDYVLWALAPSWWPIIARLKRRKILVYDCVDEHQGFNASPNVVAEEQELLKHADLVFATARTLVESKREISDDIHYVPNGVDTAHFRKKPPAPPDVKAIPRPRIGFVGALSNWVDTDLLREIAVQRPNWSLVFIGPVYVGREIVESLRLPNVHFLGTKTYEELPAYYQSLDAGLIPFKSDEILARNSNPIKAFEYLAAGLPVVSTPVPEIVRESAGAIRIADSAEDFIRAVEIWIAKDMSASETSDKDHIDRLLRSREWDDLAGALWGILMAKIGAVEGRFQDAEMYAMQALPLAPDKASLHSFVRQVRRMKRLADMGSDGLNPLRILGKLPYCLLFFPDWTRREEEWIAPLLFMAKKFHGSTKLTIAVRVDPEEIGLEEAYDRLSTELLRAGIDSESTDNITIVNDPLDEEGRDRLLLAADSILMSESPGNARTRLLLKRARDLGLKILRIDTATGKIVIE